MISPPAWGWPGIPEDDLRGGVDFPTRVGMARPAGVIWRAFL